MLIWIHSCCQTEKRTFLSVYQLGVSEDWTEANHRLIGVHWQRSGTFWNRSDLLEIYGNIYYEDSIKKFAETSSSEDRVSTFFHWNSLKIYLTRSHKISCYWISSHISKFQSKFIWFQRVLRIFQCFSPSFQ
jgi:hypothetical protein